MLPYNRAKGRIATHYGFFAVNIINYMANFLIN